MSRPGVRSGERDLLIDPDGKDCLMGGATDARVDFIRSWGNQRAADDSTCPGTCGGGATWRA